MTRSDLDCVGPDPQPPGGVVLTILPHESCQELDGAVSFTGRSPEHSHGLLLLVAAVGHRVGRALTGGGLRAGDREIRAVQRFDQGLAGSGWYEVAQATGSANIGSQK